MWNISQEIQAIDQHFYLFWLQWATSECKIHSNIYIYIFQYINKYILLYTYYIFQVESIDLALNILDGWQIRDKTLSVQRAKFQLKGAYDPSLKPKKKKKDKDKQKKIHER